MPGAGAVHLIKIARRFTLFGLDISAEVVRQLGAQATNVIQAVAALFGTVLTVYGRSRAAQPLVRREMRVRL